MYGASRYGVGGMGMPGGMGMGGMGGMDQQYSWLHSIQHFTSSLGYLTEVRRGGGRVGSLLFRLGKPAARQAASLVFRCVS